jgi:hypothetical protein
MSDDSFGLSAVQSQTKKLEMKKTKLSLRTFTNQDFKNSVLEGSDTSQMDSELKEDDEYFLEGHTDRHEVAARLSP